MYLNIDLIYIVKTLQKSLVDLELLEKKIKTPKKNRHVRKKRRRTTRKKKI